MFVEIAAKVYRGDTVEAIHHASIAVVDAGGKLSHYLGDPNHIIMSRSAIKPFQALPLILSGAADNYGFTAEQLSIICGSHNGTNEHRELVVSILDRAVCGPGDLQCGVHLPIFMRIAESYPGNGEDKDPVRHNCSGKHAGFLALAKYLGEDIGEYLNPEKKTQQAVQKAVAEITEYPQEEMRVSVDGCSAPNFSLPLFNLALGFKKLACAQGSSPEASMALARIKTAMTEYPEMFSGEGRFDLDLMRSFPGNVVCKVGAEALQGIGFSDPPLGIAVKIHDGNSRALWPVCVEVLKQLGMIAKGGDFSYLKRYESPSVRNARGLVTGQITPAFQLREA